VKRPSSYGGVSQFNYIYDPVGRRLNRLASGVSESVSPIDENFAVFSFPLANRANILDNCNLIHEFGHLIVDSSRLVNRLVDRIARRDRSRIVEIVRRRAQPSEQADFELIRREDEANQVLANWLHESLADMVGLHALGPAHLFAFLHWIQPSQSHQEDDVEHPCNSYRIRVMLDGVRKLGWEKLLSREAPAAWDTAAKISQQPRRPGDYRHNAAAECMALLEALVFDVAADECAKVAYKPEALECSLEMLLSLLKRGVPPAEYLDSQNKQFNAFDAVTILNAGWLFYEKDFPTWRERFPNLGLVEKREFLDRLLTKAVEISFVKEAARLEV